MMMAATSSPIIDAAGEHNVGASASPEISVKIDNANPHKLRAWSNMMRARYDSASNGEDGRRHWENADNLSANSANSAGVRCVLRKRSRYECANNSYAKGIVSTLANHTIGIGPRPQFSDKRISLASAKFVASELIDWMDEIRLGEKLRTMRKDKCQSGEAFGALTTNFNLASPVKLDFQTIECDRIADPYMTTTDDARNIDGVKLDVYGNPESYSVLKNHPGDLMQSQFGDADRIDADRMCHWFTADRSGQYRGIPEVTAALPLFAQLRRFTLAVIAAAETAADAAGVLYTDAPANGEAEDFPSFDGIEIEKRMMLTLPRGWKMGQIEAQQPVTTYAQFKQEILKEIARCLNMPYNIAAGDSSNYNFASGKLDANIYVTAVWIDRDQCEKIVMNKLITQWFREARLIPDYLPSDVARLSSLPRRQWHWDALDFNDPVKIATSRQIAVKSGFGNLRRFAAEDGYDFDEEQQSHAESLGVTAKELQAAMFLHLYGPNAAPTVIPDSISPLIERGSNA